MNATGPDIDPADEDEVMSPEDDAGGSDKDDNVSPTATSEKNSQSHSSSGSGAAQTQSASHSARVSQKQTEKSGIAAMIQFVTEAMIELRKITWPDRQQVIKETLSVIVLVAIITGCVLAFDYGIAKAIFEPLDKLARHLGGGIGVHH